LCAHRRLLPTVTNGVGTVDARGNAAHESYKVHESLRGKPSSVNMDVKMTYGNQKKSA
jgi:hypothetical protein